MDKTTLKSLIIEYRLSGLSFGDIADKLEKEHGIKTSRQNVCGLYKRATSDKSMNNSLDLAIKTTDICKYHSLGLNIKDIGDIINTDESKISLSKIKEIIDTNEEYIRSIENDNIGLIVSMLKSEKTMSEIISALEYKGVKVTNKQLNELIFNAACELIKNQCKSVLVDILDITNDNNLVRKVINKYNLDISIRNKDK